MKKLVFSVLFCVAFALPSFAGHEMVSSGKETHAMDTGYAASDCFRDQELQLDLFGAYAVGGHSGSYKGHAFGGGVGLNYFFARYFGIGAEGILLDSDSTLKDFAGSFILRIPTKARICTTPYFFIGGGYEFDHKDRGFGHAGAGLEFRFRPNLAVFVDGRYVVSEKSGAEHKRDYALIRAGVRLPF
jgi:opacity protein-like surface antigen